MRLIVGLGNPGLRYKSTRHNMGFLVIDRFAKTNSVRLGRREYKSLLGRANVGGEEAILMKPLTYMNLSGKAIAEIVAKEGIALERMIVVCDDADLALGTIRIRPKGSSGGHKGLESIAEHLETKEFPRMRLGIGRTARESLTDHVLTSFKKADVKAVNETIDNAVQALNYWITSGIQAAMQRFNA